MSISQIIWHSKVQKDHCKAKVVGGGGGGFEHFRSLVDRVLFLQRLVLIINFLFSFSFSKLRTSAQQKDALSQQPKNLIPHWWIN